MLPTDVSWTHFLFSPQGRFNRQRFWGATFLVYGIMIAFLVPFIVADGRNQNLGETQPWLVIAYAVFGLGLFLAAAWIHCCTIVKRFHDRDKSWPWVFITFAPYVGGLWIFVECGCLQGTRGRNRYGADPRNPTGIADVFDAPVTPAMLEARTGMAAPPAPGRAEPRLPPNFGVTSQDRPT